MSSNQGRNQAAINKFRSELQSMFGDIREIDVKVLDKSVNVGARNAKENTPVATSFMQKSWRAVPARKSKQGAEKELINTADYSSYVNDGHRIVNKLGETIGFIKGKFILEGAIRLVEKTLKNEFEKEVERVNKKHGK
ncbi:HK97 gp10 family phage protein [Aminipila terrae]|uniref:HK97 gp10 family phage protein n=1 Tax=Aminipila terrae TaxID=2697030 RepID=A0A6P1MG74_9FIRM|nr:HK97 gp10 family phage protein [Aminipila terrae]QHI72897.1 HK97 gp10 family phage protein [Aminipila terrae]